MTSDGDNTEHQPTSASSAGHSDSDSEDYPDTAAGTSHGAGDAETDFVPPAAAEHAEHAWSNEEPVTEVLSRPWRSAWAIAGIGLLCAVIVAFAIFGVVALVKENHRGGSRTAPTTTPGNSVPAPAAAASSPTAPAPPQPARPDDDEYVAMAISPAAINAPHTGGFGTAGTQDEANRIALSECRAGTGNDDCLPVNAGMYHGCVSFAVEHSGRRWAGGSGVDSDAARADARRRLPEADFVGVQCSDPPGLIKAPESPSPAAAPAPPTTVTEAPQPSVQADQIYMALISQIPGTVIADPAKAVAGGRNICPGLAAQGRASTEAAVQANDPGFSPWQAAAVVNAAITAYCPQYRGVQ
jgi:Protein of unknown function (DUF732)